MTATTSSNNAVRDAIADIRTINYRNAEFLGTLDAARHRTDSYDQSERAIITRAINRANRSMTNR